MQKYTDYSPTAFDTKGLNAEENNLQDFYIVGGQNRDSDVYTRANFKAIMNRYNNQENDNLQIHRFGHWACGWFELILVKKDTPEYEIALDIEHSLKDYPILDDDLLSEMETEDEIETLENCYIPDIEHSLTGKLQVLFRNIKNKVGLIYTAMDKTNTYFEHGGECYLDIDRIMDVLKVEIFKAYKIKAKIPS